MYYYAGYEFILTDTKNNHIEYFFEMNNWHRQW
jgi:hypothetical protein